MVGSAPCTPVVASFRSALGSEADMNWAARLADRATSGEPTAIFAAWCGNTFASLGSAAPKS